MNLPNSPHDCALWLLEQLEGLRNVGDHWEGRLPEKYDFESVVRAIPHNILRASSAIERRIEFRPGLAGVFQNLAEFLGGQNRRRIPAVFTIRDLGYTHGSSQSMPAEVKNYFDAVKLWSKLAEFAEYAKDKGTELLFIQSFDSQVWLVPEYTADDLALLPQLDEFITQYFNDKHHRDQKRNIVRAALLEIFKDQRRAKLAELLKVYRDFVDRVKSSYALYTSDFSFERLKSEVSQQNQEDTLRLNKTLSEIQNQLLALPAALLAAGAGIKLGAWHVNLAILTAIALYAWFMHQLVCNQKSSVDAIGSEIALRKKKVAAQPAEISADVMPLFDALSGRLHKQKCVLTQVSFGTWLVFAISVALVAHAHSAELARGLSYIDQILCRIGAGI